MIRSYTNIVTNENKFVPFGLKHLPPSEFIKEYQMNLVRTLFSYVQGVLI